MTGGPSDAVQRQSEPEPLSQDQAVPVSSGTPAYVNSRRESIWLALAAAEACWLTPIFLALSWALSPHPPYLLWLGMLVLMLGYFYFYRALVAANLTILLQQSLLVVGLLLSVGLILRFHTLAGLGLQGSEWLLVPFLGREDAAAVMPRSWLTIMILVFLWARAIHLATRSISAGRVSFSFRSGVLILVVVAFFVRIVAGLDVSVFVVPYFFFALVAVALARVEDVRLLPNSSPVPFSGFWIGSSVGAVAVLVLLGMVVSLFFYGGGLRQLFEWLSPVLIVLQIIVIGLGALFLMLMEWIITQLSLDLSFFTEALQEVYERLGQLLVPLPPPPATEEAATQPLILKILWLLIAIAIPLVIISLVLLFTWHRLRRGGREQEGDEARESFLSVGAVARNLRIMLQDGLDRLGELAGMVRRFGPGSRFLAAISIRRIYANLVRLATNVGYPRSRAQTPYEYLKVLYEALPNSHEDVTVITEAYVNARYGQVPDTREELQRIRDCWDRIRAQRVESRQETAG